MTRPSELEFEEHFCRELEKPVGNSQMTFARRETKNVDLKHLVDDEVLTQFLQETQKDDLDELKKDLGKEWLSFFKEKLAKQLETTFLFELIRDGIEVKGRHFKLVYFQPETTYNKEQWNRYEANKLTYVRQFAFRETQESIDVVLFLNGLPIITIELKNKLTGQNVDDAVSQFLKRDTTHKIFKMPFLHLAADTTEAKIATQFINNSGDDFVPFNTDVTNPDKLNDFPVEYLYREIFRPESLIEIIESYLFSFLEKNKTGNDVKLFRFPRYHQRRTVINLSRNLRSHFKKNKELNKRYLIQHSAGSGKSYTIAVLQKVLRSAHVDDVPLLNSIIIVTDRLNLDTQIESTVSSSETQAEVVKHAETSAELAELLNKNTKVIISTLQKFSVKKLDEILESQKGKRICFMIDEAHRSQAGKLHKKMVEKFDSEEELRPEEEIIEGIGKKKYPNAIFVAFTATPSDKTLNLFGTPFDSYSMDQAEKEGYVLNVAENIITYSTLAKLSQEIESRAEYPALVVAKKVKGIVYDDDAVIKDKVNRMLKIFENQTKNEISGRAKAMIVTSSRLSAVKYKLYLDEELHKRGLPYKTLVAFSGSVNYKGQSYTEINMNKIKERIEDEFNKNDYRFIIVANKYQYGFNQPLLQTMFLDKPVSGSNAVQTISRLNRVKEGKNKTLVVDFTNSYEAIIAAFRKYKKEVKDFKDADPRQLAVLRQKIISQNIFTEADATEFLTAYYASTNPAATTAVMTRIYDKLKTLSEQDAREFKALLNRFNDLFNYINNLFAVQDQDLRNFAVFTNYLARFIDPLGRGGKLDQELKNVFVLLHKIRKVERKPLDLDKTIKHVVSKPRAPKYATIPEVIEAVNEYYDLALGSTERYLLEQYLKEAINNPDVQMGIRGTPASEWDNLYATTLQRVLKEFFFDFFLKHAPEKLAEYMQKGVLDELNREAFRLSCGAKHG